MTVKELIAKLQKCNPDAEVCVEAWMDGCVHEVKEYTDGDYNCVYIGDNLEQLTYMLIEDQGFEEVDHEKCNSNA